ncbi:ABC transporter permease [Puia sp.]|jgi:hypothetical protein|uniref:ABC transporter permease n=1 Tax=Puia sp. TaxID=2045100 RepID=UPI002F42F2A6
MFKSYWTIAWRTLSRNKLYTLINVLGLTLGLAACLVIWVITQYEFSFDKDHPDAGRIYRLNSYFPFVPGEPETRIPAVAAELPPAVRKNIPGVETVAPYFLLQDGIATIAAMDKRTTRFDAQAIFAGADYLTILPYQGLAGDARSTLEQPFSVVLTEKKARLYFGSGPLEGMIGREVIYDDSLRVHVGAIVRDWAGHTDFPYTELISVSTAARCWLGDQYGLRGAPVKGIPSADRVLIKLAAGADRPTVSAALTALFDREFKDRIATRVEMQALRDIHFSAGAPEATARTSQLSTLYALLGIAIFILVLAVINYVNLATAQSLTREKEIGIRKIMGSARANLVLQLLAETFLLTGVAGLAAVFLVTPVLGAFHEFIPPQLKYDPLAPANLLFLLGMMAATTLLAGMYPAQKLSAFSPMLSLKGAAAPRGTGKWWFRKGLIVFQFTVSLLFIIGTLVIGRQIRFMLNTDLGFNRDAVVLLDTGESRDSVGNVKLLAESLRHLPGVSAVARENMPPMGPDRGVFTIQYRVRSDERIGVEAIKADEHFIPLYHIRLLAGRNLLPSDTLKEVVINESLSKQLGFQHPEQAVGQLIHTWNRNVPIVGVVGDFQEFSFHEAIQPTLIAAMACTDLALRLDVRDRPASEARAILARVERRWKEFYPHKPFEYNFLDEWIAQLFQREKTMEWLMNTATAITIFISCIGLFGLTLFTTARRTREIGIRKVLGAGIGDIVTLLGRDFVVLIGIALVIASALGGWLMHRWLEDFVYRVRIGVDIFLLAGAVLLFITILTIGVQSLKAALVNPAESLRTDG